METLRLINAGSLALATLGREWVADDQPTSAYLLVAVDEPAVALSRLRTLGRLLAPRLALHADLWLFVTTGTTPPDDAALALSEGLGDAGGDIAIAALRGEDRLGLIDELLAEGLVLSHGMAGKLEAAWGETAANAVLRPLSAGARCVLAQGADAGAFAAAAAAHCFGETVDGPLARRAASQGSATVFGSPVVVTRGEAGPAPSIRAREEATDRLWIVGAVGFVLPLSAPLVAVVDRQPTLLPPRVKRFNSVNVTGLSSPDRDILVEAARRVELLGGLAGVDLGAPLERSITLNRSLWTTSAPRARVEADPLAFDLRTAAEWRE
jgi:hypothetical protein